eukprot:COSAG06_NODE_1887_length_8141_cov_11.312609_11_plen_196_part_00
MPPCCRRGRLAAAFPRPHVSGRLAPASAWAVWPWSLPPVCSLPRVCYLSIAILSRLHTILGALTLRRRPAVTPSSAHTSLEQRSLSPGVTAPLSWLLPIRLPPLARRRARRLYLHRRRRVVTRGHLTTGAVVATRRQRSVRRLRCRGRSDSGGANSSGDGQRRRDGSSSRGGGSANGLGARSHGRDDTFRHSSNF